MARIFLAFCLIMIPANAEEASGEKDDNFALKMLRKAPKKHKDVMENAKISYGFNIERNVNASANNETVYNPGFKMRITQRGLDYGNTLAMNVLMKQLKKLQIPDVNDKIGSAQVTINNIRVKSFPRPKSSLTIIEGSGLRWNATGLAPVVKAKYKAEFKFGWYKTSKSGRLTVRAKDLGFSLDFAVGRGHNGSLTIYASNCESTGDIDVKFKGQMSKLLNLGSSLFKSKIATIISGNICDKVKEEITGKASVEIGKMRVREKVAENYELDFSLTENPFYGDYFESYHRGTVFSTKKPDGPPFEPPVMPQLPNLKNNMVFMFISDYALNSGLFAAFHNDDLKFKTESHEFPDEVAAYFAPSCPGEVCLGTVFPQIEEQYPGAPLQIMVDAIEPPEVKFSRRVRLKAKFNTTFFALKDNEKHFLFTSLSAKVKVKVNGSHVYFHVQEFTPKVKVEDVAFSDWQTRDVVFKDIIQMLVKEVLYPKIRELGVEGFDLPDIPGVKFGNPRILHPKGARHVIVIGTDLYYDMPDKF